MTKKVYNLDTLEITFYNFLRPQWTNVLNKLEFLSLASLFPSSLIFVGKARHLPKSGWRTSKLLHPGGVCPYIAHGLKRPARDKHTNLFNYGCKEFYKIDTCGKFQKHFAHITYGHSKISYTITHSHSVFKMVYNLFCYGCKLQA